MERDAGRRVDSGGLAGMGIYLFPMGNKGAVYAFFLRNVGRLRWGDK